MRVTNIDHIRDFVKSAVCGVEGADPKTPLAAFSVDKGTTTGDIIGMIGDARFLLKIEGLTDVVAGSTLQVDLQSGEISAVVPPKKTAAAARKDAEPRKAKSASPSRSEHLSIMG